MTARDGYFEGGGGAVTTQLFSGEVAISSDYGYLQVNTQAVVANVIYKNHGWYNTGNAFEVWVTSGNPSTAPPSGHTLLDIGFVVLQQ